MSDKEITSNVIKSSLKRRAGSYAVAYVLLRPIKDRQTEEYLDNHKDSTLSEKELTKRAKSYSKARFIRRHIYRTHEAKKNR